MRFSVVIAAGPKNQCIKPADLHVIRIEPRHVDVDSENNAFSARCISAHFPSVGNVAERDIRFNRLTVSGTRRFQCFIGGC